MLELAGKRFGKLVAIRRLKKLKWSSRVWLCRCKCGRLKEICAASLTKGDTNSCGCGRITHGQSGNGLTTEYTIWGAMIGRCQCKSNGQYHYYGGRGIAVCKRWKKFTNFLADMGKRPKNHSLDRIDNNKNYCKKNCRWATYSQQARNNRNNRILTLNGMSKSVTEWMEIKGLSRSTIYSRIYRGCTDAEILSKVIKNV